MRPSEWASPWASTAASPSPAVARIQERRRVPSQHRPGPPPSCTMASKKNKKGGGKTGGEIEICPIFCSDHIDDSPGLEQRVERNLKGIQAEMEDFGMHKDRLEYYDSREEWQPLTSKVVENWRDGVLKIRDPDEFKAFEQAYKAYGRNDSDDSDDEKEYEEGDYANRDPDAPDDEEEYEEEDYANRDPDAPVPEMRATIAELVVACREEGRARAAPGRLRDARGKVVDTAGWVMARAAADPALLHLIVDRVGALDHLVRCLHLDPVWEGKLQPEEERSDEEEYKRF